MSKIGMIAAFVLCCGLITWGYVRGSRDASAEYAALIAKEKDAHAETKKALEAALATGMEWRAAYDEMEGTAAAYQRDAQACLVREKDWRNAVERQENILREASVRLRPAEERDYVVDAATRRRAAAALNAAW